MFLSSRLFYGYCQTNLPQPSPWRFIRFPICIQHLEQHLAAYDWGHLWVSYQGSHFSLLQTFEQFLFLTDSWLFSLFTTHLVLPLFWECEKFSALTSCAGLVLEFFVFQNSATLNSLCCPFLLPVLLLNSTWMCYRYPEDKIHAISFFCGLRT